MTDPVAIPSGTAVALGAAATLTCAQAAACLSGMPLELFVWGTAGGLVAMIYAEPKQPPLVGFTLARHAAGRLLAASLLGGGLSGLLLPWAARNVPMFSGVDQIVAAPPTTAMVIGIATAFLPDLFKAGREWIQRRAAQ